MGGVVGAAGSAALVVQVVRVVVRVALTRVSSLLDSTGHTGRSPWDGTALGADTARLACLGGLDNPQSVGPGGDELGEGAREG